MVKISEWQGGSGNYYVADTSDLANNSGVWYRVPRLLNIPLVDFVSMLLKYEATIVFNRESGNLIYYWTEDKYQKAHRYLLDMNKKLKNI